MTRNYQCRHYHRCLAEAARLNAKDVPCQACEFRHDRSTRTDLGDLLGCFTLLAAVFGDLPVDPRQARSLIENGLADIITAVADRPAYLGVLR